MSALIDGSRRCLKLASGAVAALLLMLGVTLGVAAPAETPERVDQDSDPGREVESAEEQEVGSEPVADESQPGESKSVVGAAETSQSSPTPQIQPGAPAPAEPGDDQRAATGSSLTQSMAADSGVAVQTLCTNCNNADLTIAGMGNDHVSVVCDGMPIPSGLAQIYLLSVMPATMIDKVAVNKGAGDVGLAGGAVGGGIEIQRREPEGLVLNAAADAGSYGWRGARVDLTGMTPGGKFGGSFVGSMARSDAIDANRDEFANLPEFDRTTIEGSLEFRPGRDHRLRLTGFYYDEDQLDGPASAAIFALTFYGYNREDVQLSRSQYDLLYEWKTGGGTLSLTGAWAERSQDIQETDTLSLAFEGFQCFDWYDEQFKDICPTYFIDEQNRFGSVSYAHSIGHQARIRGGLSSSDRQFDVVDVRFNTGGLNPNLPRDFVFQEGLLETGVWVEGETALGSKLELALGLRWVDFEYSDNEAELIGYSQNREIWLDVPLPSEAKLVPRAALTWKPQRELQLRVSAGQGFRAPAPIFDEVCCGRRYRGNRGVLPEEADSYGLEFTWQPGPKYRLAAAAFHTDFENHVMRIATLSFQGQHTYQNVNIPRARTQSLNVEGSFQATRWLTTKVAYTLLDVQNRSRRGDCGFDSAWGTGDGAICSLIDYFNEPTEKEFNYSGVPYSNNGRGAIGLNFRLRDNAALTLAGQYTGRTLVQYFDSRGELGVFDPETSSQVGEELVKTEDFWVVNLTVNKAFRNGMAFFVGVDNVSDTVQSDLGIPEFDHNWGLLRGRYLYAGLSYSLGAGGP